MLIKRIISIQLNLPHDRFRLFRMFHTFYDDVHIKTIKTSARKYIAL